MNEGKTLQGKGKCLAPEVKFTFLVLGILLSAAAIASLLRGQNPFPEILIPVSVLVPVVWLGAEVNGWRLRARVLLGVGTLVCVVLATSYLAGILPSYESFHHRVGMEKLGELLQEGQNEAVSQAVARYNEVTAQGGNTFSAISAMEKLLSERDGDKETEEN